MKDPVQSPYGNQFEKIAIEHWFKKYGNRCPITGKIILLWNI